MPPSTMLYAFGIQMLIIDIMRLAGMRAPLRISSLPRGSPLRPGIYSIIEDVCAVDGGGGTEFPATAQSQISSQSLLSPDAAPTDAVLGHWRPGNRGRHYYGDIHDIKKCRLCCKCSRTTMFRECTLTASRLVGQYRLAGPQSGPSSRPCMCSQV